MQQSLPRHNLRQIVLPYFDITTETYGYQFGLPPRPARTRLEKSMAEGAGLDVLLVSNEGAVRYVQHPQLVYPQGGQPPRPAWAWTAVQVEGDVFMARVVAPTRDRASVPTGELHERSLFGRACRFITTTAGRLVTGADEAPCDIPHAVVLSTPLLDPDTYMSVAVGGHEVARLHGEGTCLWAIEPLPFAYQHGLWTSHLLRLVETEYARVYEPEPCY